MRNSHSLQAYEENVSKLSTQSVSILEEKFGLYLPAFHRQQQYQEFQNI